MKYIVIHNTDPKLNIVVEAKNEISKLEILKSIGNSDYTHVVKYDCWSTKFLAD